MSMFTREDLTGFQSRPFSEQYMDAQIKCLEAVRLSMGNFQVSFSGGKDSCLLLYMVSEACKSIGYNGLIHVGFADTSNEFSGIYKHIPFFLEWLEQEFGLKYELHHQRPRMQVKDPISGKRIVKNATFPEVVRTRGYPFISKEVAKMIGTIQNDVARTGADLDTLRRFRGNGYENVRALEDIGFSKSGVHYLTGYRYAADTFGTLAIIPKMWVPLVYSGFYITDKCCSVLKKGSLKFEGVSITGEMADESKLRTSAYLETGCIGSIIQGTGKAKPLGPMTQQCALSIIKEKGIPLASPYGEVVQEGDCYRCTGVPRTGCVLCGFGIKQNPDRFVWSAELEPAKIAFAFKPRDQGGLGYGELIEYMNENCSTKILVPKL